jgi:hypothetical protein
MAPQDRDRGDGMSAEDELASALLEVTMILAPVKARQALMTTVAATRMFLLLYGREPNSDAVGDRFVKEACDLDCTEEDLQWLVDAGLIHTDVLLGWKVANREHA